ncbi:exonuclease I [Achromatium sp. WMS2]|nr:exonuclease I [Achromatium sp. WMS2]
MPNSFYWHDYETWGADPSYDRPVQFAGLRTDWELNPIGKPLVVYARPSNDILPCPEACLITHLTPQYVIAKGSIPEAEFISRIHHELARPNTCSTGYNNLRFDDEVTRYTLYRNFYDPYAREWRNGNSRWDLIDVIRLAHALRPEGIDWPYQDGVVSFRLTDLSAANNISHLGAHEALSDVLATISLAKLLLRVQPKLFNFALELRNKKRVRDLIDPRNPQPILHVSSKYLAEHGCIAPVLALANHPVNTNEIIVVDLRLDPQILLDLDSQEIHDLIFTKQQDLPANVQRLPIKTVHLNRVPMLAPLNTLTSQAGERWNINPDLVNQNASYLRPQLPTIAAKLQQVFTRTQPYPEREPEQDLYRGFLSAADATLCEIIRNTQPDKLSALQLEFQDPRLAPMFSRYRARNWPETLTAAEIADWDNYRRQHVLGPAMAPRLNLDSFREELAKLRLQHSSDPKNMQIINNLELWGKNLF